jgi:uncharacterized protein (TIGR00730 family)
MSDKPVAAYLNEDFLKSKEARTLRILSEYLEPEKRFEEMHITNTVVFFGSARIRPTDNQDSIKHDTAEYYYAAEEFAYRLAVWSKEMEREGHGFHIITGGGNGIMEAANKGADRAGANTIGLNISIPFEQKPNKYITPELNFEFHYFFMRKLWFLYHAKAIVVFPGGFGTLDELFETLTLIQTRKMEKGNIPILLYDKDFWDDLINFRKLVDHGLISQNDIKLFYFFKDLDQGMEYLKPRLKDLIQKVSSGLVRV